MSRRMFLSRYVPEVIEAIICAYLSFDYSGVKDVVTWTPDYTTSYPHLMEVDWKALVVYKFRQYLTEPGKGQFPSWRQFYNYLSYTFMRPNADGTLQVNNKLHKKHPIIDLSPLREDPNATYMFSFPRLGIHLTADMFTLIKVGDTAYLVVIFDVHRLRHAIIFDSVYVRMGMSAVKNQVKHLRVKIDDMDLTRVGCEFQVVYSPHHHDIKVYLSRHYDIHPGFVMYCDYLQKFLY